MDATLNLDTSRALVASRPHRFDPISIAVHWASAALIAALFASAWSMALATDRVQAERLLTLHRSLGVISWAVAIGRLCWRLLWARVPPLPASTRTLQRGAAWLVEYGLYAILLFQPLTGLAHSLFRGRPFALFLWEVPKTVARDKALSSLFERIHGATAWALLGLVGLHVGAALFHRFVAKDQVLQSMLPWPSSIQKRGRWSRGGPLQARNDAT